LKLNEIRKSFLKYFEKKDHKIIPSSNLVPKNDPSLLFANAGMNQFKDVFLGLDKRDYMKATTCQKCVRAGGKHNDLENVGFTFRHHTFFEMLGNFSFGDYFKKEAINYAWEFLINVLKIPKDKLYVTVFKNDTEAYKIWEKEIGIDKKRILKLGEKDNFWSMGEVGPCGPCSEIFYDNGKEFSCGKKCTVGCDCDRFVEIWNLVFMQYEKDKKGNLKNLPAPSVDTGAGLERLAAVMQGVRSNYDIDIFKEIKNNIIKNIEVKEDISSLNAIADHLRSIAFLISDGCFPSNEGAGYVLRRIIRRAIRHGKKLGFNKPFLYKKILKVIDLMGKDYPELKKSKNQVVDILKREEEKFIDMLEKGLKLLEQEIKNLKSSTLSSEFAFKLYDTYGFPFDLTKMILKEKNIKVDEKGFYKFMKKQKEKSKIASESKGNKKNVIDKNLEALKNNLKNIKFLFTGYDEVEAKAKCVLILKDGKTLEKVEKDTNDVVLVFDKTPFYASSGGQKNDLGYLYKGKEKIADIINVEKPINGIHVHLLDKIKKEINVNDTYQLMIENTYRKLTERNHTATHILHYVLRKKLGEHVKQSGSNVSHDNFTFDFSHFEKINNKKLREIEKEVNIWILKSKDIEVQTLKYEKAIKKGALALFLDKYTDEVRVININDESIELCGGTHVKNTSEIGVFKILNETSIGSGLRRIEALTSYKAYEYMSDAINKLDDTVTELNIPKEDFSSYFKKLYEENKLLRKKTKDLKTDDFKKQVDTIFKNKKIFKGIDFIFYKSKNINLNDLKTKLDFIKGRQNKNLVVFMTSVIDKKVVYLVYVSKDVQKTVDARTLVKFLNESFKGRGGGKLDLAQGGGDFIENFSKIEEILKNRIQEIIGE
jgi:alanyl-tRNA synthetase